jgi:hypothetical protein
MHSHPIKLQPQSFIAFAHLYSFRPHHCTMHPLSKHRSILQLHREHHARGASTDHHYLQHKSQSEAAQHNSHNHLHEVTKVTRASLQPTSHHEVTKVTRASLQPTSHHSTTRIISLHKNKHFHMKTLTHNARGNSEVLARQTECGQHQASGYHV